MRILALERDLAPLGGAISADLLRREAAEVWALQRQGVIRDIWFTPGRQAVLMLECPDAAEARRQLATLPLAQAGLIDFMVHELVAYDGFERLFAPVAGGPSPKPEEPPEY